MRTIKTVAGQTIFDLAVQEYGNVEAAFQILADNPQLAGTNKVSQGYVYPPGTDFDVSLPIVEGVTINITEGLEIENTIIARNIDTVISG